MKKLNIYYSDVIVWPPKKEVKFDANFEEFLSQPNCFYFMVNSSSFQFEKLEPFKARIETIIRNLKKHGIEAKAVINATNKEMASQKSSQDIYYVTNPHYLARMFYDQRIHLPITTFGQGTSKIARYFAPNKNILVVPMIKDQLNNALAEQKYRTETGGPEMNIIQKFSEVDSDLILKIVKKIINTQGKFSQDRSFEEIIDGGLLDAQTDGVLFMLLQILNMEGLDETLREQIIAIISKYIEN